MTVKIWFVETYSKQQVKFKRSIVLFYKKNVLYDYFIVECKKLIYIDKN